MKRWGWAVLIGAMFSCLVAVVAFGQTVVAVDINRAALSWDWSKGTGGDVEAFNLKCGPAPGSYTLPPFVVPVPGAPASYTGNVPVKSVVTAPGRYYCIVTASNLFGESGPSNELPFDAGNAPGAAVNLRLIAQ